MAAAADHEGDLDLSKASKQEMQKALTEGKMPQMRILEEDDEFEEFEEGCAYLRCAGVSTRACQLCAVACAAWTPADATKDDEKMWQDDWDDDEIDTGFCNQLRAQLVASGVLPSGGSAAEGKA